MSGSPSPADPSSIHVDIDDRQQAYSTKSATLARLLSAVLREQHGEVTGEVGLAFIELDEMRELNRDHMGVDAPTDVLAFPIDAAPGRDPVPAGQPVMFGDIVICPEYASRAPQPLDDELPSSPAPPFGRRVPPDRARSGYSSEPTAKLIPPNFRKPRFDKNLEAFALRVFVGVFGPPLPWGCEHQRQ